MSSPHTESELLRQAMAGDRAALSQLLLIHYDDLRRHIVARLSGDLERLIHVDDVLHQTFVRAAQAIERHQPRQEGAFRAWLRVIAENLIKDAEKRRRRERLAFVQEVAPGLSGGSSIGPAIVERIAGNGSSPSIRGQRHENADRIQAALADLPPDQREVLERFYLQNQSLDQIAEGLGVTKGAIRGLCYRARKNLRAILGQSSLYFSG